MKLKVIGKIMIVFNILLIPVSFSLCAGVGEVDVFGTTGLIRYSWVLLLFLPVASICLFFGLYLKRKKEKYKINVLIAFISIVFLSVIGSYRFVFNSIATYDDHNILFVEQKLNIELPDNLKIANEKNDNYSVTYAQIKSTEEKNFFENELPNNKKWNKNLNSAINGCLPLNIQVELKQFDYFLVADSSAISFDSSSFSNGEHKIILIAYDIEKARFVILVEYKITIMK